MADPHQVCAGERPALFLRALVPRPRQHERRHIHPSLPTIYIWQYLLPKIHLYLLPHRQLRHRLIFSRRYALFQPVLLPEQLHIPGYRPPAHLFPVVFPQPVSYLGRCQVWKFTQPLQNLCLLLVQVLYPADSAAHSPVLVYRHFQIPFYCFAVDSKPLRHFPLAEPRRTKLSVTSLYQMAAFGFHSVAKIGTLYLSIYNWPFSGRRPKLQR